MQHNTIHKNNPTVIKQTESCGLTSVIVIISIGTPNTYKYTPSIVRTKTALQRNGQHKAHQQHSI